MAAAAVVLVLCLLPARGEAAAADPIVTAKARAAALAERLQALRVRLEALDERYDQARSAYRQIGIRLSLNARQVQAGRQQIERLAEELRSEAVAAFMSQGSGGVLGDLDLSGISALIVRETYLKAAVYAQQDTASQLVLENRSLMEARHRLYLEHLALRRLVAAEAADRAEASAALRSEARLLAVARGRLASLLAQREREQAAARLRAAAELRTASSATPAVPSWATPPPSAQASIALRVAEAQLGKPYVWGAAGPDAFDCSGLVMYAYAAAGISLPHSAQLQYDETVRISYAQAQPGDLVFYGYGPNDVFHVGIYVGNGVMIDAPYTGTVVRYDPVWSSMLVGFGRVAG